MVGSNAVAVKRHYPFLQVLHRVYRENLKGKPGAITVKELARHPKLQNYCFVSADLSAWVDRDGQELFDTLLNEGWLKLARTRFNRKPAFDSSWTIWPVRP